MDRPEPSCEEAQGGRVRQVLQLECRDRNHDQSISEGAVSRRRHRHKGTCKGGADLVFVVPLRGLVWMETARKFVICGAGGKALLPD